MNPQPSLPPNHHFKDSLSMLNAFWAAITKYAIKLAVYAAGHPTEVKAVLNAMRK